MINNTNIKEEREDVQNAGPVGSARAVPEHLTVAQIATALCLLAPTVQVEDVDHLQAVGGMSGRVSVAHIRLDAGPERRLPVHWL